MSARVFGSGTAAGETTARGDAPSLPDSGTAPSASAAAAGPASRSGTRVAGRFDDRLAAGFLNSRAAVKGNAALYSANLPSRSKAINREPEPTQSAQLAAALRAPPPRKNSARSSFWSRDRSSANSNDGACASNLIGPAAAEVPIASTPMTAMTHLWNTCTSNDGSEQGAYPTRECRRMREIVACSPDNPRSHLRSRRCPAELNRCPVPREAPRRLLRSGRHRCGVPDRGRGQSSPMSRMLSMSARPLW
jgi:hypothetical protein